MKNTIIIILSIAVIVLGGYFVYDKVIVKNDKNVVSDNNNNGSNNDEIVSRDKDEYVGLALSRYAMLEWYLDGKIANEPDYIIRSIDLPKILFDTENAKKLNAKIYADYTDNINNLNVKTERPFSYNITYSYSIKDNILSLMITKVSINHRGSGGTFRHVYYYDMKNDKELNADEISKMFNITLDKVKKYTSEQNKETATGISAIMPNPNYCDVYYTTQTSHEVAQIRY